MEIEKIKVSLKKEIAMKPGTQEATEYARIYNIEPQKEEEADADFRGRVSGVLRDRNLIIEAHEAFNNERFDQSDDVMTGIMGAMAQKLQNADYGSEGERQVDDDFAAGIVVQAPKKDASMALLSLMLFGDKR
ncbi:MAG: hypothetical protein Q8L37_04890 [Candidatus Gottesmanbacteria bacterium]|nr:hypothetical protein [Candidatus Gottesmanbacteria bacterium]